MIVKQGYIVCARCSRKSFWGEAEACLGCGLLTDRWFERTTFKTEKYTVSIERNSTQILSKDGMKCIAIFPFKVSIKIDDSTIEKYLILK